MVDRRRAAEVDGERGLPHGGSRSHDNHLAGVEPAGELIELDEAGRDPGQRPVVAVLGGFDLQVGLAQELGDGDVVLLLPLVVGHRVDLRLGERDELGDVAGVGGVPQLGDAGTGLDQATHERLVLDDAGVVAGIGGGGDGGHEGGQVRGAADPFELASLGELIGDDERVGGLGAVVDLDDRVEDRLVGGAVELRAAQDVDDVGDGLLAQEHAAERGHLGLEVLGWEAVEGGAVGADASAVGAARSGLSAHAVVHPATSRTVTPVGPGSSYCSRRRPAASGRRSPAWSARVTITPSSRPRKLSSSPVLGISAPPLWEDPQSLGTEVGRLWTRMCALEATPPQEGDFSLGYQESESSGFL